MTKVRSFISAPVCAAPLPIKVAQIETRMANCHCSMCRKFHGAAFATFGEAKSGNFQWLTGQELLKSYTAYNGATRQFCSVCGSSLTFSPANDEHQFIEFSLGSLDTDIPLRPDAHIYIGSKANWIELHDELPKYTEGRGSRLIKEND